MQRDRKYLLSILCVFWRLSLESLFPFAVKRRAGEIDCTIRKNDCNTSEELVRICLLITKNVPGYLAISHCKFFSRTSSTHDEFSSVSDLVTVCDVSSCNRS